MDSPWCPQSSPSFPSREELFDHRKLGNQYRLRFFRVNLNQAKFTKMLQNNLRRLRCMNDIVTWKTYRSLWAIAAASALSCSSIFCRSCVAFREVFVSISISRGEATNSPQVKHAPDPSCAQTMRPQETQLFTSWCLLEHNKEYHRIKLLRDIYGPFDSAIHLAHLIIRITIISVTKHDFSLKLAALPDWCVAHLEAKQLQGCLPVRRTVSRSLPSSE